MPPYEDFSSEDLAEEIWAMTEREEPSMVKAFLAAMASLLGVSTVYRLTQRVDDGEIMGMSEVVNDALAQVEVDSEAFAPVQQSVMQQAGQLTADAIGPAYNGVSPRALTAASNITSYLVRYVSESIQENLRQIIRDQIEGVITRDEARRRIRQQVGLLPQHALAVQNLESNLLASGMSIAQAQAQAAAYAERLLRYRAEMISRTEVARAASVGQQEYWEQLADDGFLPPNTLRKWIVTPDEKLCEICGPMDDLLIPLDGFWNLNNGDQVYYPTDSHPNCRCSMGLVFPDQFGKADPLGLQRWLAMRPTVVKHANHDQKSHGNWAKGRKKKQAARRVLVGAAALRPFADRGYSRSLGEFYAEKYGWQSDKPMEYEKRYEQSFSPFPFDKERQMWPPETYEAGMERFEGNEEEWEGWKRKKLKELGLDYERNIRTLDWEGGEYFGRRFTNYKRISDTERKDAHEAVMGLTGSGGGLDFKEFTENYKSEIRIALGGFRGYTLNDLDVALWNGWRQSPYEDSSFPANRVRTAMHVAAVQLFDEERNMESWLKGVREYNDENRNDPYAIDAYQASELVVAPDERQQKGVQAARGWWEHNYAETQKAFADAGVTHVALTRGYTKRFEGDTITPRETTAVSSWTANPEMAARFAGGFGVFDPPPGYFNPNPPWRNTRGTVAYDLVPVEDIALVIGGTESEVVVINRPGKSYPSMTFPEGTQDTQAAEIISSRLQGMIDRDNDGIVGEGTDQERFVGKHADHDQKSHGNWARGGRLAEVVDGFRDSVKPCSTADGSLTQCIRVELQFRQWLQANHPELGYKSYYVRGAKPEAIDEDRLDFLDFDYAMEPKRIRQGQNHNIPVVGFPKEGGGVEWVAVDWTYRQFKPDSEWPLIESVEEAIGRWDESQVFNEKLPASSLYKHADHDQKSHGNWAKGRSGKSLSEQVDDAWDAILKPSSQSDVMEAFPERFEQRYLAERGVETKYLKIGETITRSEQTPDGRWQLYDITPWDTKNLGSPYAGDNRPTIVPGSRGNDMSNPNVRVEGSERPGDFVYRVMAESEYQQAMERGYFGSDQRMNIGNEGTVFSKDKTGTFYWPKEEPARIVRFKYDPEIMYFDKADEYIKTGSHYVDTGEGGYNRTEVNPVIKPVPLDLVDEVSALLPSKNDIQADRDERRKVGKHADHDQKTHGNWAKGRSLDVIEEFDWESKGMGRARLTYEWLDANGDTVFPSQPGVGTAFFTSRAGELPGQAIVRNDSGEMEVVDITISNPFILGRNPKLTRKQKKAILDTLNKISPEFRPTHVQVAAKSNIGGGWYVQNQDVLRSNEIVISLWSIPGIFENDEIWEVFTSEPELAAAIGKPLGDISRWKKYIQTLQVRPSEEAWGHLEKTVIHEAGHAAERRMWEGLPPIDEQVWRGHISAKWIDETRGFFDEHFLYLGDPDTAGTGRYRNGPYDQHYYLAATNQLGDTALGKKLKLKYSSENDSQSDARADAELFAEWFRFGVQGLPFPNGHILDEFFDGVIDGDGDGFVFDGTDQERRA